MEDNTPPQNGPRIPWDQAFEQAELEEWFLAQVILQTCLRETGTTRRTILWYFLLWKQEHERTHPATFRRLKALRDFQPTPESFEPQGPKLGGYLGDLYDKALRQAQLEGAKDAEVFLLAVAHQGPYEVRKALLDCHLEVLRRYSTDDGISYTPIRGFLTRYPATYRRMEALLRAEKQVEEARGEPDEGSSQGQTGT